MTHPEREEVTAQIEAAKQHDTYRTPAEAELAESEAELSALMDVFNDQAAENEALKDAEQSEHDKHLEAEATIERLRAALEAVIPALEADAAREDERYDEEAELALHDGTGNPGLVPRPAAIALERVLIALHEGSPE